MQKKAGFDVEILDYTSTLKAIDGEIRCCECGSLGNRGKSNYIADGRPMTEVIENVNVTTGSQASHVEAPAFLSVVAFHHRGAKLC